ncbi:class I SAM-dependent methyltransferase [Bacillus swezeyi]|uniref:S-adenosyl-L-methionine-dependent methyltransferase n=1 Tax=Bacillus swezeyi TaxID=1925020 RepID=A0A1R1RSA1_9BACI|nr:class I SAM-dependent methyltransferase [Bacillus swezeyi]MEC1262272.1 class I SAM-dependent methyltransferase [Bacillus swezeyi]MED2927160.1 class I SAM-dependent methyltransferase [Bacillus swezeyi]MED2962358.1 class I SAM-dependent methyltransferase [Bacillus swezeyi]MED2976959.1 class I SAM-dependent methyltransferase [Bacillus swezeyi]MED3072187.1 class I SAM-dependent methyltransferase [Bacillus swezeyi]
MKKDESSLTSLISSFGRAYHSQFDEPKIFDDHIAKDFISQHEFHDIKENMIQGIQFFNKDIAEKFKGDKEEILKWITQIQLSPTPLARAAYLEKVLHHEIQLGVKQYVILGAGLDTFCFRHPELKNILDIFEIDHPATQEFKKKRLAEAHFEIPSHLHLISKDFTNHFSYQDLIDKGFHCSKKTFFSLLGVSYYLTKEENARLMQHVMDDVPSGSAIVFDYADENLFKEKGISNRVENMVKMAAASGEPMKSCYSYHEMEKMLEKSGLLIVEHLSPAEIHELYFKDRNDYLAAFETIHYIHAIKK